MGLDLREQHPHYGQWDRADCVTGFGKDDDDDDDDDDDGPNGNKEVPQKPLPQEM